MNYNILDYKLANDYNNLKLNLKVTKTVNYYYF